jgi:hypothetical protein
MFSTFKALGFLWGLGQLGLDFIQGAIFAIKVNGIISDFSLGWSMKQGCPLYPYLFVLTSDELGYLLDNPKYKVLRLYHSISVFYKHHRPLHNQKKFQPKEN